MNITFQNPRDLTQGFVAEITAASGILRVLCATASDAQACAYHWNQVSDFISSKIFYAMPDEVQKLNN
jgi:hypothetical protein